jgi:hypothetical protein
MKTALKIAAIAVVLLATSWIASGVLGTTKLRSQVAAKFKEEIFWHNNAKADPPFPQNTMPSIKVVLLRTPYPLIFEAHTIVNGQYLHWDGFDRYQQANVVMDDYVENTRASYLYTPWRVYEIKVWDHSKSLHSGVSQYEKCLRDLQEEAMRGMQLERGEILPNQVLAPMSTSVTAPSRQELHQP